MTNPTPEVFIVGAGPVGAALAMKLSRAGVPVAGIHGRKAEQAASVGAMAGVLGTSGDYPHILAQSDIVILAVPDREIATVAKELVRLKMLSSGQVVLHCSGALSAEEALGPAKGHVAGIGTLHPLISFADARLAAAALEGATFAVEGDEVGRQAAHQLAARLSGTVVTLHAKDMSLYHAAAVLACNDVVALVDAGASLLGQVGFSKAQALTALIPLLGGTVRNLAELGLPEALTGPVARGDADVIERHMEALAASRPELLGLYQEAGKRALAMSRELGRAPADSLDKIDRLLAAQKAPNGFHKGKGNGPSKAQANGIRPVDVKASASRPTKAKVKATAKATAKGRSRRA